jgi:hypothetical protein
MTNILKKNIYDTNMLDIFNVIKKNVEDEYEDENEAIKNFELILVNMYYNKKNIFTWRIYEKLYILKKSINNVKILIQRNLTDIINNEINEINSSNININNINNTNIFIKKYYNHLKLLKNELIFNDNETEIYEFAFTILVKKYLNYQNNESIINIIFKKFILQTDIKDVNEIVDIIYKINNNSNNIYLNNIMNLNINNILYNLMKEDNTNASLPHIQKNIKFLEQLILNNNNVYKKILPNNFCIFIQLKFINYILKLMNVSLINTNSNINIIIYIYENKEILNYIDNYISFFELNINDDKWLKQSELFISKIKEVYKNTNSHIINNYLIYNNKISNNIKEIINDEWKKELYLYKLNNEINKNIINKSFEYYIQNSLSLIDKKFSKNSLMNNNIMKELNNLFSNINNINNNIKFNKINECFIKKSFNDFINDKPLLIRYICASFSMYIAKITILENTMSTNPVNKEKKITKNHNILYNIIMFTKFYENINIFLENYIDKLSIRLRKIQKISLLGIEEKYIELITKLYGNIKPINIMKKMLYDIKMNFEYKYDLKNLQLECKSEEVNMFKDINFKNLIFQKLNTTILSPNVWKNIKKDDIKCKMPTEIEASKYLIQKYYNAKHLNRKLKWINTKGKIISTLKINNNDYNIISNPIQISFLYLYNGENISYTKEEIIKKLEIKNIIFDTTIHILLKSKLIIKKDDKYHFNNNYNNKIKVINLILLSDNNTINTIKNIVDDKKDLTKTEKEMEYLIDTRIVKLLKNVFGKSTNLTLKDKSLSQLEIIISVKKLLNIYAKLTNKVIIKRIVKLENREYIETLGKIEKDEDIRYIYVP